MSIQVPKLNTYAILGPVDDRIAVSKVNVYVIVEAGVSAAAPRRRTQGHIRYGERS